MSKKNIAKKLNWGKVRKGWVVSKRLFIKG